MSEKFYRIEDVAEILKMSVRSVFRYIHEGKLRATKIGYWRISEADLNAFISESANVNNSAKK